MAGARHLALRFRWPQQCCAMRHTLLAHQTKRLFAGHCAALHEGCMAGILFSLGFA